jgi:hypothetical protein
MPYPTPSTPTLLQISTNDFVNYKGVKYAIASVVSVTDNGEQQYSAIVTITVGQQTVTLNLTNADTIVSHVNIDQAGVAHAHWRQSENA